MIIGECLVEIHQVLLKSMRNPTRTPTQLARRSRKEGNLGVKSTNLTPVPLRLVFTILQLITGRPEQQSHLVSPSTRSKREDRPRNWSENMRNNMKKMNRPLVIVFMLYCFGFSCILIPGSVLLSRLKLSLRRSFWETPFLSTIHHSLGLLISLLTCGSVRLS